MRISATSPHRLGSPPLRRIRTLITATGALLALTATLSLSSASANPERTFRSETAYLSSGRPSLTHAIKVAHVYGFLRAIRRARAGQTIEVLPGVRIGGKFTGFNRVIKGGTVNVVFDKGAGFTGMQGRDTAAVFIQDAGGWRVWGGTITNPDGPGILVYDMPGPFTWTGFNVSDTGDTCVAVYPVYGNIDNLVLKGVAGTADPNLDYDPHEEKGTGIHAWNIADATGGVVENSTFAADVLNQATGAGVEIDAGQIGPNVILYTRAKHVGFAVPGTSWTGDAQDQVAGNAIQLWGDSIRGHLDIKYAEAGDIQGRILETNGASAGANYSNASLDYGIAAGPILLNPRLERVAYNTRDTGIKLGLVTPRP